MRLGVQSYALCIPPILGAVCLLSRVLAEPPSSESADLWPAAEQHPVNLIQHFDNDGIAAPPNIQDGNFDCPDHPDHVPGSTYPGELMPETGAVVGLGDKPRLLFLFPSKLPGENNNVSCQGQRLAFGNGNYRAAYVLGASENGTFTGDVRLDYEDGPEDARLALTDWCRPAEHGERIAFEFPYRYSWVGGKTAREDIPCRLWLQTIPLDTNRVLRSIALPFERRMHVFALTLHRADRQRVPDEIARELPAEARDTAQLYLALRTQTASLAESLKAEIEPLRRSIAQLTGLDRFRRELHWLMASLDYTEWQLPADGFRVVGRTANRTRRTLQQVKQDLERIRGGEDPFARRQGQILKSYYSDLDDSWQTYSVAVPDDYTGEKPFPLFVRLHGHGGYAPFQGHPVAAAKGVIIASPHGRGSVDYMLAAEPDALQVIAEVCRDYRIDTNRVVLEGQSMGGTGSWNIGAKFADRFAGIAPVCGNTHHDVFFRDRPIPWAPADSFRALHDYLQAVNDPLTYADNLANLPVFCMHGALDTVVRVEHARRMIDRLRALGAAPTYREFPDRGHWGFPDTAYEQRWQWMLAQSRRSQTARVRFKTARLRYGGAYWLRLEQFEQFGCLAEVDAEQDEDATVRVRCANVAELSIVSELLPRPPGARNLVVRFDDGETREIDPDHARFHKVAGAWRQQEAPAGGLRKRSGLEGPVEDAFLSPFLLVYGTISADPVWRQIWQGEAERVAADWQRLYRVRPRIKADTQVTDEDIRALNLILYGGPAENAVTARLGEHFPLRLSEAGIRLGDRVFTGDQLAARICYPNPLAPTRYVVLSLACDPVAAWQLDNRFGSFTGWGPMDNWNWFDYAVIDGRSQNPDTMVCVGFFGPTWEICEKTQWQGDPARRQEAIPRVRPRFIRLPADQGASDRLWLSDLLPARVDQHKGTANADRSYGHRPLRVGTRLCRKGFGVCPPSVLEFLLDGRYSHFRSAYGADLEGAQQIGGEGAQSVRMQFIVSGDGKRLWSSEWLRWNQYPPPVEVDIKGVRTLSLEVLGGGPMWLYGSAAWGDAEVYRKDIAR